MKTVKVVATTNLEALKEGIKILINFSENIINNSSCKTVDHIMKDMNAEQVAKLAYVMEGVMIFANHFEDHCIKYLADRGLQVETVRPFTSANSNNIH